MVICSDSKRMLPDIATNVTRYRHSLQTNVTRYRHMSIKKGRQKPQNTLLQPLLQHCRHPIAFAQIRPTSSSSIIIRPPSEPYTTAIRALYDRHPSLIRTPSGSSTLPIANYTQLIQNYTFRFSVPFPSNPHNSLSLIIFPSPTSHSLHVHFVLRLILHSCEL